MGPGRVCTHQWPRGVCEAHDVRGHLAGPAVAAAFLPGRRGRAEHTVRVKSRDTPSLRQRCRHVLSGESLRTTTVLKSGRRISW